MRPVQCSLIRPVLTLVVVSTLSACAGYHSQTVGTVTALHTGNPDAALAQLESANRSSDKELLYYLEKGEVLRMKGAYGASRDQWLLADQRVRAWEDQAKKDPSKLFGDIGSVLVNDTTRRYDGRDYEKVFLNLRLALDHIALGNWDNARTEIKKMHEREAIISDFRIKELDASRKSAQDKGLKVTSFKELSGYPVDTLIDPAVQSLKNSYESAFGNYLAGFVYEKLGEPSLAAPGYRKAAEMRPDNPVIDEGLRGLDSRLRLPGSNKVDTLFVVESGSAPAIRSKSLPIVLPIPGRNGISLIATPISWPVIASSNTSFTPSSMTVDGAPTPIAMLTNVDLMARRSLADEMPSIIARSSVRAILKGGAQKAIDDNASKFGAAGLLIGLAAKAATVGTEVADERAWLTLPGTFSIARVPLSEGAHRIAFQTASGPQSADIRVSGSHSLVSVRLSGPNLFVAQSPSTLPSTIAAAEAK